MPARHWRHARNRVGREDVGTFNVAGKPYKIEMVAYDTAFDPDKMIVRGLRKRRDL